MRFEKLKIGEAIEATFDAGYWPTDGLKKALENLSLPKRATSKSAGYDFYSPYDVVIKKGQTVRIPLLVRVVGMPTHAVLVLADRSGLSLGKGLCMDNGVGIIDADYDKGIVYQATATKQDVIINQGDRVCQGIFLNYLTVQDDEAKGKRSGGLGSTGK